MANKDNADTEGAYSRLNRLAKYNSYTERIDRSLAITRNNGLIEKYPDNLAVALFSIRGMTTISQTADTLRHDVQEAFATQILQVLPEASVHLIETSEILGRRFAIARALLQTERPAVGNDGTEAQFSSALGLFSDTLIGIAAYVNPMLTSLSPHVWGIASGRPGGIVVYVFGGPVEGLADAPQELLTLFAPRNSRPSRGLRASPAPAAFETTLNWWIGQLDRVFAATTDLSNYVLGGEYVPAIAVERLLSVEQFFRTCQSIAASQRDPHARLSWLFNSLDLLEGILPGTQWHSLVNARDSRERLESLEQSLPAEVREVLLPRARNGVVALEELQKGFFLKSRLTAEGIRLPTRDRDEVVPLDRAIALWLRVVRNGHHGFEREQKPRDRALLASHDGEIPNELCDIAWLLLVDLMAHPELLLKRG